jgi:hypothetical protein
VLNVADRSLLQTKTRLLANNGQNGRGRPSEASGSYLLWVSGNRRPVMRTQEEETVVPFAPGNNSHSGNPDQLDHAGQTILQLLNKAAGVAEENSRHAIETAQSLSHQLRCREQNCGARGGGLGLSGASRARGTMVAPSLHRDRGPLFASRPKRASRRAATTIKRREFHNFARK